MSSLDWFVNINAKLKSESLDDDELLQILRELPGRVDELKSDPSVSDEETGRVIEESLVLLQRSEKKLIERVDEVKTEIHNFLKSRNLVKKYYQE